MSEGGGRGKGVGGRAYGTPFVTKTLRLQDVL